LSKSPQSLPKDRYKPRSFKEKATILHTVLRIQHINREVVGLGFHALQYTVENNPSHADESIELRWRIEIFRRIEVVIEELNMSANSVTVQGFMSWDRLSEPWYGKLMVIIENKSNREKYIVIMIR
jgi:hypothetical protein